MVGCHPEDVIAVWRDMGVWPEKDQPRRRRRRDHDDTAANAVPAPRTMDVQRSEDARRMSQLALAIWREGIHPKDTLADRYLTGRGLLLGAVDNVSEVVRFHPACPRGEGGGGAKGRRQPAMISLMRSIFTDQPCAIHRRFLHDDGSKDGKPVALGPVVGTAIKLCSQASTFAAELSWCERLHIAEGVETGWRAIQTAGFCPLWALGAAGEVLRFPVLFGVGELVVIADNDKAGIEAAQWAVWRWKQAKRPACWFFPDMAGADVDDLAKQLQL
jgi:hypothetical protein